VIAVMHAMMLLDLWVVSAMAMTISTSRRSATVAACCAGAKSWCFGVGKKQTCQQSSQLDRYQAGASSWLINQAKLE
jgi:hypothetical protein